MLGPVDSTEPQDGTAFNGSTCTVIGGLEPMYCYFWMGYRCSFRDRDRLVEQSILRPIAGPGSPDAVPQREPHELIAH